MLGTARDPAVLAIALDADARSLRDGSRRALRAGLRNALFVVAAVERVPPELTAGADLVTVHFPWGSLLRGILAGEPAVLGGLAAIARPGAELRVLVSVAERDGLAPCDATTFPRLAASYRAHGLDLESSRDASGPEIAASRSSWAKRLGAAARRHVVLARFRRLS